MDAGAPNPAVRALAPRKALTPVWACYHGGMATDLTALATRFCKALGDDTGNRPMQWRAIVPIGVRARILDPKELASIVDHAEEAGWIEVQDDLSVALTEAGRRL